MPKPCSGKSCRLYSGIFPILGSILRGYGVIAGHYIVVCGYDSETDRFMIQDPASSAQLNSVPTSNLEAARHAYGTDEDLLLVTVPPSLSFGHPLVRL